MKTLTISLILMTLFAMHAYAAEYERRNFSGADRLPVFQDGDVFKWCNFSQPEPHTQIGYTVVEGTDPPQYRLAEAPTCGGGDATAANQTTILADLAAIKGAAFSTTTDSLEAIRNRGDAAWTTSTVSEDKVAVNEDTGGTDNLRYMYNGQPISGATIRAYTKADYTAGTYTLRGKTTTNDEGRWTTPIYLDDGVAYTLVFNKHGEYGPTAVEVTP